MLTVPDNNFVYVKKLKKNDLHSAIKNIPIADEQSLRSEHFQNEIVKSIRSLSNGIYDDLVVAIKIRLEKPPYFVIVRGLDIKQNINILISLLCGIGKIIEPYNKPWSKVIHPLRPSIEWERGVTDSLSENLHTDGTNWIYPNDFTSLVCINPDQLGGGRSRLVDMDTLFQDFTDLKGIESLQNCFGVEMPWKIASELGGGIHWSPIFQKTELRWMEFTIRQAILTEKITLTDEMEFVLKHVSNFLDNYHNHFDFMLESNDVLIFDNKRTLHARTPIINPKYSERFYYRIKLDKI